MWQSVQVFALLCWHAEAFVIPCATRATQTASRFVSGTRIFSFRQQRRTPINRGSGRTAVAPLIMSLKEEQEESGESRYLSLTNLTREQVGFPVDCRLEIACIRVELSREA